MGHRQKMTSRQLLEWDSMQYKARKEAMKGHNYQYYSEVLQKYMDEKGYVFYQFTDGRSHRTIGVTIKQDAISSESEAIEIVNNLRKNGNYARIICGYEQNVQRIKMYSIIYKKK